MYEFAAWTQNFDPFFGTDYRFLVFLTVHLAHVVPHDFIVFFLTYRFRNLILKLLAFVPSYYSVIERKSSHAPTPFFNPHRGTRHFVFGTF